MDLVTLTEELEKELGRLKFSSPVAFVTLHHAVQRLQPTLVIGVGSFAARQARLALADTSVQVGKIHHPSPASPAANRNWQETVLAELETLDVKI